MNQSEPWTIQRLLTWTANYFKEHGAESPRLDAEVLLSSTLACPRIDLYTRFDQAPAAADLDRFRQLVKRRAAGEPVAYLVQLKEFFSLPLAITADVLIPRPETELLVVETLDRARKMGADEPLLIADVGTGSGNVAIALAKHLPRARILATDISSAALHVATANAKSLGLESQIEFFEGDLLTPVLDRGPFHFVVSNPPYIGQSERDSLARSVVDYEPAVALFSTDAGGTEIVERLAAQALVALRPGGFFVCEISPIIAPKIRVFLGGQPGWSSVEIKKDLANLERIAIAQKKI